MTPTHNFPNSQFHHLTTISLFLFFFILSSFSHAQRPDLIIGAHFSQQMLFDPNLEQHYYAPGIAFDMEVSKNRLAGQVSLGVKGAGPRDVDDNPTQFTKYFMNLDLSFGVFLIKHPSFKWRFNIGASNLLNLNKYHNGSAFNIPRYTLQATPELSFRYRYCMASLYYSLPVVGFNSRGTGIRIGIGF